MLTAFFVVTTAVCAIGWLVTRIAANALVLYIKEKGYMPPSEDETKACVKRVVTEMFKKSK